MQVWPAHAIGPDRLGEMLESDLALVGERDRGTQRLLELADVERVGICDQRACGLLLQRDLRRLLGDAAEDRRDQRADVLAPGAQRRQRDDVPDESRVEVL